MNTPVHEAMRKQAEKNGIPFETVEPFVDSYINRLDELKKEYTSFRYESTIATVVKTIETDLKEGLNMITKTYAEF